MCRVGSCRFLLVEGSIINVASRRQFSLPGNIHSRLFGSLVCITIALLCYTVF